MRRLALGACVLVLAAAGCKSSPKAGAYLCSQSDAACPGDLTCICGQCVRRETQAACSLSVVPHLGADPGLLEYERLDVDVTARTGGGNLATEFGGTVSLAFELADGRRWCDVTPGTVKLVGGAATTRVFLNRETIAPQAPRLVARAGLAHGESARIDVAAAPLAKDPDPVIRPVTTVPFYGANIAVAEPAVVMTARGLLLYYSAAASMGTSTVVADPSIVVAALGEGCKHVDAAAPCTIDATLPPTRVLSPTAGTAYAQYVGSPAPLRAGADVYLAFIGFDVATGVSLGVARLVGGTALDPAGVRAPVFGSADCPTYCDGSTFSPWLLARPGGTSELYFSVLKPAPDLGAGASAPGAVVGRAVSTDLASFVPSPAPILNGEVGGETVLFGAKVLVDRGVYKVWYTYARDFAVGCGASWSVGYATSSDGLYWIRSPSNPVLEAGTVAWEQGSTSVQLGSVLPLDGEDPANGLAFYYDAFPPQPLVAGATCLANGVGRATAAAPR